MAGRCDCQTRSDHDTHGPHQSESQKSKKVALLRDEETWIYELEFSTKDNIDGLGTPTECYAQI